MDWVNLVVGAVLGAVIGIILQNLMFPSVQSWLAERRRRAFFQAARVAWDKVEQLHPRLVLVQAGWDRDGYFPEGTAILKLEGPFQLVGERLLELRARHASEWMEAGFKDGDTVGVSAISIVRTSDDPQDELAARSHHLALRAHRYRYFDFLATHMLRLRGSDDERAFLEETAGAPSPDKPVLGFPDPCSVGLSVFCEEGTQLVLSRRSMTAASGGLWQAGRVFNGVAEMAAIRDFVVGLDGASEATPDAIAKRGLHEEMGFTQEDIYASVVRIHSFAWASDLLDHKFLGLAISPLPRGEIRARWETACDRSESLVMGLDIRPARTARECLDLLSSMMHDRDDWAPEAVFATIRSLLCLRRVRPKDVVNICETHR